MTHAILCGRLTAAICHVSLFRSLRARIPLRPAFCTVVWSTCAMTAAAWADSSSSTATTAGSSILPDVTVIAPRPPAPQELAGEAVPNFVTSHAVPSIVIHQLTRWRVDICPETLGLSPASNAFVTARIEAVAAAVGAPYDAGVQCKYHNVQILFSTEPQKQLDEVMKLDSRLLGFHYSQQTEKVATFSRPVQGWYVTSTRNDSGHETVDDPFPLPAVDPRGFHSPVPPGRPGSRLYNARSSLIVNALVVVDANKVQGMPIGPISDYVAMLVLSQSKSPDSCSQLPSIIDLMAANCREGEKPSQITAGDLAFLRALYKADLETPIELEESNLEDSMMRQFKSH
jgi:hypothetical protein